MQQVINALEDQVLVGGFVISEAMGDLRLLIGDIERSQDLLKLPIIQRLRDINSTLNDYYMAG